MGNLEHKIKEAFKLNDPSVTFTGKQQMWKRLEGSMHAKNGVAAFWRVAALFLVFLLASGAFAAFSVYSNQTNKLAKSASEIEKLTATIDSLKVISATPKKEIQFVEKEKVVYRDKIVYKENEDTKNYWEQKFTAFSDSTKTLLANREAVYRNELQKLNIALTEARKKTEKSGSEKSNRETTQKSPFLLKTERVNLSVAKTPQVKKTELQIQIFQKNYKGNKNDLNRTIFKK